MPEFHSACHVDELPPGGVRTVTVDGTKIALCNRDGVFYALSNFCPHLTGNLGEGCLEGDVLVCPEHGWRFKLDTGRCTTVRGKAAHSFPVEIRDGWVYVGV
ncbi:MAG: Rieske (2Fe-2S) protein [Planctomycetia bacterium]